MKEVSTLQESSTDPRGTTSFAPWQTTLVAADIGLLLLIKVSQHNEVLPMSGCPPGAGAAFYAR